MRVAAIVVLLHSVFCGHIGNEGLQPLLCPYSVGTGSPVTGPDLTQ